ncbi:conserved hypothetical protein [Verrucomicrobiia bacterium DG1235]|nr:conserved hypothetical protein [Verrucomicrobiae bacterium DG1235]
MQFENVTALAKANLYFDGKVVSHSIITPDGEKKTLGVILAGTYHFDTGAPERMDIVDGACWVTIDGSEANSEYDAGTFFDVAGNSGFTIEVAESCQYVCSYLA